MIRFIAVFLCASLCLGGCGILDHRGENDPIRRTQLDLATVEPDPAFGYTLEHTHDLGGGAMGYTLRLTSQTWRDSTEVSDPVWTHDLQIVRPAAPDSSTALLLISGGRRTDSPRADLDPTLLELAKATNSVCVLLPNVPNQPLAIIDQDDPAGNTYRVEDDLIAQSWERAIDERDASWVAQIAMVKSAIAAMDATQSFLKEQPDSIGIEDFVVTGASKRGWTTWLTGAVDQRIRGLMPIVIDIFNLPESIQHHWHAYGEWSPAIHDYTDRKLFKPLGTRRGRVVRRNVDPYLYRDRYTMPKFLLNSAGDQFFLPDTAQNYIDDLPGETRLRFVPNTDHDLDRGEDAQPRGHQSSLESLAGFHEAIEHHRSLPKLRWVHARGINLSGNRPEHMNLSIRCDRKPVHVVLWEARNPAGRDFRQSTIGNAWVARPLKPTKDHRAATQIHVPESGYVAYFIEVRFDIPDQDLDVTFTTPIFVAPDTLPYKDLPMK
ncbi:MAG: PhoPQ-activated protein PqaA family protein [Phycisphaerales bacterium]